MPLAEFGYLGKGHGGRERGRVWAWGWCFYWGWGAVDQRWLKGSRVLPSSTLKESRVTSGPPAPNPLTPAPEM